MIFILYFYQEFGITKKVLKQLVKVLFLHILRIRASEKYQL